MTRYEIKSGDLWVTASKAVPVKNGWLHYELREGRTLVVGLAKPGNWRVKARKRA